MASASPVNGNAWWRRPTNLWASSRLGAAMLRPTMHLIDRPLMRLTRGRCAMTFGLPTLLLTTTGVKSGKSRTAPLLAIPHGEDLAIIGTRFGSTQHPAWHFNLQAKPEATVEFRGERWAARARPASEEERVSIWPTAVRIYPGYDKYKGRVGGREIPIYVLERATG